LTAGNVETLLETVKFCIADVRTVEEADEVEETEPGNQTEVELPEELSVLCI